MGRVLIALPAMALVVSACGGGEYTQEELDSAIEVAVAEAVEEALAETGASQTTSSAEPPTTTTTVLATTTTAERSTTTSTAPVELDESDPRNAAAIEGNAAPPLSVGDPGVLTVINAAYTVNTRFSSTRVQLVVRNNSEEEVYGVEVAMTVRDGNGGLLATGDTSGMFPYRIGPGEIAFAEAFLNDVELPEGAQFEFQVSSSDTDERFVSQNNLRVSEHGLQGERVLAILENINEETQQLAQAAVMCFLENGSISGYEDAFVDLDEIPPGETGPVTVDIGDVDCPIYLVAGKAFDA